MKNSRLVLVLALACAGVLITRNQETTLPIESSSVGSEDLDTLSTWLFTSGDSDILSVWAELEYHEMGVDFVIRERDPATDQLFEHSIGVSTPFGIEAIAARHSTDVVVAGRYPDGRFTIEAWRARPADGSLITTLPTATTAVGVPALKEWPQLIVKGDNGFIPPADRSTGMQPQKTVIYLGDDYSGARKGCLSVDPHGRFVLFIDDQSSNLVQIDVQSGAGTVIANSATYPLLASPNITLLASAEEEITSGEYWWFVTPENLSSGNSIAFVDADNDGVINRVEEYTPQDWADSSFAGNEEFISHLGYASASF